MAHSVRFRPAAERDLRKLYAYIRGASGSPNVAIGYIRRIRAFCDGLSFFPERGRKRDDIRPGLQIIGFERRVAIVFMFSGDVVLIGRIFYGGRDYVTLLGDSADD